MNKIFGWFAIGFIPPKAGNTAWSERPAVTAYSAKSPAGDFSPLGGYLHSERSGGGGIIVLLILFIQFGFRKLIEVIL